MTTSTGSAVADNIRAELARRRIAQSRLGEVLGINQRAVSRRLLGYVEFTAREVKTVADLFDIPVGDLYEPRDASAESEATA